MGVEALDSRKADKIGSLIKERQTQVGKIVDNMSRVSKKTKTHSLGLPDPQGPQ